MERHRGTCPTCGAHLQILKGESMMCPECGMPVDLPEFEEEEEMEEEPEEEWE